MKREVAALILSRGLQGSQLMEDYLKWFAEEMVRAAGEAAHLIGEIPAHQSHRHSPPQEDKPRRSGAC